jgi:hypothetical protein
MTESKAMTDAFIADCKAVREAWNGNVSHTNVAGMNKSKMGVIARYLGLISKWSSRKFDEWYDTSEGTKVLSINKQMFGKPISRWKLVKTDKGILMVVD